MKTIRLRRHEISLVPECARVINRPFIPGEKGRVEGIVGGAMALTKEQVSEELAEVNREFESRHLDCEGAYLRNFRKVEKHIPEAHSLSHERRLLIGALFSGEYALESAALFNPSIVPHPDQVGIEPGGLRFVMSLRATGEGHISSIEFRTGEISPQGEITLDPVTRFVSEPEILENPSYRKKSFILKLREMGFENHHFTAAVLNPLGDHFTLSELNKSIRTVRREGSGPLRELETTLATIQWLADSNYEVEFSSKLEMSERIIFPVSPNETNGIEDARFVMFTEEDGSVKYYATYTAYNGHSILPQLIETEDFLHFQILTLNGSAVSNKGMALFPRMVGGRYAMLSRQDDENLFIMFSDSPHFWSDPHFILGPHEMWNSVKIGNCGSPIETEAGWLVITHGVGPMRRYCIGAALLDLEDPRKVIGRLSRPLLEPEGEGREGYVPNVVYSCGSLLHGRNLILPFAMSDRASAIATISLDDLLAELCPRSVASLTAG